MDKRRDLVVGKGEVEMSDVKIKALEWEEKDGCSEAKCAFGRYEICPHYNYVELLIGSVVSSIRLTRIALELDATLIDLKAAAQADFESRVRECLE